MSAFTRESASAALAGLMRPDETWEPLADGRARIVAPSGATRIAHRHTCLACERVVGWGDDCEADSDHDFALCPAHAGADLNV